MNRHTSVFVAKLKLAIVLLSALAGSLDVDAKPTPFSRIVVFGDSLSDTGNLHRMTGGFPP